MPDIHFTKVRIFNKEYNIHEFKKKDSNSQNIVLNHNQNFFAVSFVATDFINGENCRYSYKLEISIMYGWIHALMKRNLQISLPEIIH